MLLKAKEPILTENGSDLDSPASRGSSGASGASNSSSTGNLFHPAPSSLHGSFAGFHGYHGGGSFGGMLGAAGVLSSFHGYYVPENGEGNGDNEPVEIVHVLEIPEPHFLSDIEELTGWNDCD